MPKVGLVCPDKTKVLSADCLSKCRMGSRCLTKSTLASMCYDRPWSGKASTTQLLKPSRIAFLEITQPYYCDPQDMAWLIIGTRAHAKLETGKTDVSVLEKFFADENETGVLDCYERENDYGILTDNKVVGSYSVSKMLRPKPDFGGYDMQLNRYRLFLEANNQPVDEMQLECFVRDGHTQSAYKNGIQNNIYVIQVPRIENNVVLDFFAGQRNRLLTALNAKVAPERCTYDERWQNRRCKGYCNVAESCDWGQRVIKGEIK